MANCPGWFALNIWSSSSSREFMLMYAFEPCRGHLPFGHVEIALGTFRRIRYRELRGKVGMEMMEDGIPLRSRERLGRNTAQRHRSLSTPTPIVPIFPQCPHPKSPTFSIPSALREKLEVALQVSEAEVHSLKSPLMTPSCSKRTTMRQDRASVPSRSAISTMRSRGPLPVRRRRLA